MSITETRFQFRDGMEELKKVDYLIVHHTASTRDMTAAEIHAEHLNLGWLGIGYHFYIRKDGSVWRGRPEDGVGSHCEGYNSVSLGICLSGNFEIEEPTLEQLNSLKSLIRELKAKHPKATVHSHSDFNATACCGRNLRNRLKELEKKESYVKVFANGGKISLVFENGEKVSRLFFDEKELLRNLRNGIKFEV